MPLNAPRTRDKTAGPTILVVAYHFAPENVSGTHRSLHFARSLYDAGDDVQVLTVPVDQARASDASLNRVFPYPERVTRVAEGKTLGRLYLSARGQRQADYQADSGPANARGSRATGGQRRRLGPLRQLRRHVAAWDALPDHQRGWYKTAVRAGLQLARDLEVDAVFASGPPWTGLLVAAALARKTGVPFIADFRDPWTGNTGRQTPYDFEWCHRLAKRWERRVFRDATLTLFNSPAIMDRAVAHYRDLDWGAVQTILNGSNAPRRAESSSFPVSPPLVFSHFGNLYRGRSIEPLIDGLQVLLKRGSLEPGDVRIDLVGRRADEVQRLSSSPPAGIGIQAISTLPYQEAIKRMAEPSVLLVAQPPNLNVQIPTKLYDYLCTGNPVVVMAAEDSATWRTGVDFPRCRRLDYSELEGNAAVLTELVDNWRAGSLLQVRTTKDTAALTKRALGEEFVRAVNAMIESADDSKLRRVNLASTR